MSLHERRDFRDLVLTVGERSGAGAAIVEKDYWVTEALRVISREFGDGVVFKGGTSLSKGWHLISRFSEDIDLLIRTSDGESHGQRDRYMKEIDEAVERLPGLTGATQGRRSDRGVSRTAAYSYESQAPALAGLASTISLEMGIRGGVHPIERRELDSMLAEHLRHSGLEDDELEPFQLDLLDYRRTFLEKLFAIHSAATRHLEGDAGALNGRVATTTTSTTSSPKMTSSRSPAATTTAPSRSRSTRSHERIFRASIAPRTNSDSATVPPSILGLTFSRARSRVRTQPLPLLRRIPNLRRDPRAARPLPRDPLVAVEGRTNSFGMREAG